MKHVVLINPPWYFAHPREAIVPHNLGLGYLAAYLRRQGAKVTLINSLAESWAAVKVRGRYQTYYRVGLGYDELAGRIPDDAQLIGISAPFTNNAVIVKELADVLKTRRPGVPIVLGGVYPSLMPVESAHPAIDFYVAGEGELALAAIATGSDPESVRGVWRFGASPAAASAEAVAELDSLPFPVRDESFLRRYPAFSPRGERLRTASVITSRGCPFDCSFCSIHLVTGYAWRRRSPENVLAELRELIARYGIEHVEFEDDNLTLDRVRALELFEGIARLNTAGKPVTWSTPNGVRVDSLDRGVLEVMKRSGCRSLSFGVESADPVLVERMNKRLEFDKVSEMTALCRELGIRTNIFLMLGYPGETDESFRRTLAAVRELKKRGADVFYATVTRAYPGTKLYRECRERALLPGDAVREEVFLGNTLTPGNALVTPDFNAAALRRRLRALERLTVPWHLRTYRRCAPLLKKVIPDACIQRIKRCVRKTPAVLQ